MIQWDNEKCKKGCSYGQGSAVFPVEPRGAHTIFLEKKIHFSKYISANTKSAMSAQRNEVTLYIVWFMRFSITQVVRNACASAGIETVDGHQPDQAFQW